MDRVSRGIRSKIMASVHSRNTKPERSVRRLLHSNGFRFRLHRKDLPGRPDLFLKKYGTVIFVHGCFWHGHANCRYGRLPKSNTEFWAKKIENNIARDKKSVRDLKRKGYRVFVVWECHIKKSIKRKLSLCRPIMNRLCEQRALGARIV